MLFDCIYLFIYFVLVVLSGRVNGGRRKGQVLINGEQRDKNFKHYAHYVPQEDHLMGTMTVKETLYVSLLLSSIHNYVARDQFSGKKSLKGLG